MSESVNRTLHSARRALGKGDSNLALILGKKCLGKEPNNPECLFLLALANYHSGELEVARELIQRAITISKERPEFLNFLGVILLSSEGKISEAITAFENALVLDPKFSEAHNNLGGAFNRKQQFSAAEFHFSQALALNENYVDAHYNSGLLMQKLHRRDEAIEHYSRWSALTETNRRRTLPLTFEEILKGGGVLLTLPRLQSRAEHSLQRLHEAGFENIEFIYGVDGSMTQVDEYEEEHGFRLDPLFKSNVGICGYIFSSYQLWKKVIDENLDYLLIFEDDVLPHPKIRELGNKWWNETPKDADIIFLGNQMPVGPTQPRVVQIPCYCTHAYIITNQGARRIFEILQEEDKGCGKVDCEFYEWMVYKKLHFYCWNGSGISLPYATSQEMAESLSTESQLSEPDAESGKVSKTGESFEDTIYWGRHTGLFYQNYSPVSHVGC